MWDCFYSRTGGVAWILFNYIIIMTVWLLLGRGSWARQISIRLGCALWNEVRFPKLQVLRQNLFFTQPGFVREVSLFCCCAIQCAVSQAALQLRGQVWLAPCQECVFGECIYGEIWLFFFFSQKSKQRRSPSRSAQQNLLKIRFAVLRNSEQL